MHSKINIHNFWRSHTFIVLVFAIMSLMSVMVSWHAGFVTKGNDFYFHIQRIYDLRASILNGDWNPLVALNRYHQTGTAIMGLYPKINLYPLVLLTFVIKSVLNFYYIAFAGRNFLALLVAYFASFGFNHSKKTSFIFAITYVVNNIMIFHVIEDYDLGISASMIFLPLVMFGFMELLRRNRWIELTIGMSLVILCHVLNTVIVVSFLLIFALINIRKFKNREKIFALLKAVITTVLLTSIFTIPFFIIMGSNSISVPQGFNALGGYSFIQLLLNVFNDAIFATITLSMFLGLILGFIKYKRLNSISKQLLWIALLFIIFSSNIIPWDDLDQTILNNVLQFSWRLCIIPELILSYIFAEVLWEFFDPEKESKMVIIIIAILTMLLQIKGQHADVKFDSHYSVLKSTRVSFTKKRILSNDAFHKLIYYKQRIADYYPSKALSHIKKINEHYAYDGDKPFKTNSDGNARFTFTNKKYIKNLSLPFLYYNGVNYQVKLDGKNVKTYSSDKSLVAINNVSKGNHHVQIIVHKTKAEIVSYVLSFAGLVILLGAIIKGYILKRKNKDK